MRIATLADQVGRYVRFSNRHNTPTIDVAVLRRLSGLALRAASDKGYADFLDNRGDDLIPVWNMAPWLHLERAATDPADYDQLFSLIHPVEQFARTLFKLPTFGTREFVAAPARIKNQALKDMVNKRWAATRKVTPHSIKALHAALQRGDTWFIAAKDLGVSIPTARAIARRRYPHTTPELDAAWLETFGQPKSPSELGVFKKQSPASTGGTRTNKDARNAELIRRMFARLENESKSKNLKTNEEATKALALTKTKIGEIIGIKSQNWGAESLIAWLETFGKAK